MRPIHSLAAAIYRKHQLGADQILYMIETEQTLHFQQGSPFSAGWERIGMQIAAMSPSG